MPFADLVGELADGEDLPHARRRRRRRSRTTRANGPSRVDERQAQVDAQVLLERLLGVHDHRRAGPARPRRGSKDSGPLSKAAARSPLASTSHSSVRLPLPAARSARRRGDRGLADAALAGDEQQPPIEQARRVVHRGRLAVRRRSRCGVRRWTRRGRRRPRARAGYPDLATVAVGQPQHRGVAPCSIASISATAQVVAVGRRRRSTLELLAGVSHADADDHRLFLSVPHRTARVVIGTCRGDHRSFSSWL